MRTETKIITYYKFSELSEASQEKALSNLYNINVSDSYWYESTKEDAKQIKCKIVEFDIDRGSYCKMQLGYEPDVIEAILTKHGETCETYKIASEYKSKILDAEGNVYSDIALDFRQELQEEYLSILRREYEFLTSEAAIKETIEANEYEFNEEGKLI